MMMRMVMMIGMMMTVMTLMIELMMMMISTSQVMEGNSNTYLAAKQELSPVIIASKVFQFSSFRPFLLTTCCCSFIASFFFY